MTRKLLRKTAVACRYGVTERTIDRWTADAAKNFPRPIYIIASPLWDEQELEQWECSRVVNDEPRMIGPSEIDELLESITGQPEEEIFRYVARSDVPKLMAEGWEPLPALEGTHHSERAVLMRRVEQPASEAAE